MSLKTISDRLLETRKKAEWFVAKRRSDLDLYRMLAECLSICEDVENERLLDDLKDQYLAKPDDSRQRRYFESTADVFLVVGRLVFEGEKRRDACWRYTATLREASKRQIKSTQLVNWLKENGGVNALFRTRPVSARTSSTRTLHLNEPVTILKGASFTLRLRRDDKGFFDVLEQSS